MAGAARVTRALAPVLDRVTRVRGVRGVVLAGHEDGLVVAATVRDDAEAADLAALGASLVQRLRRVGDAAGTGATRVVHLRAEHGLLCATPVGDDLLLVALGDASTNLGLVRLALLDAAAELA
jgi:predicted regulator of Ras-like GTPase activity (Roadblock/LC7/MglB family)